MFLVLLQIEMIKVVVAGRVKISIIAAFRSTELCPEGRDLRIRRKIWCSGLCTALFAAMKK
jgi:hypothetical protein